MSFGKDGKTQYTWGDLEKLGNGHRDNNMSEYEVVTAKCHKCGKVMKLSFDKGAKTRYTWCRGCKEGVIWKRLEEITFKCDRCKDTGEVAAPNGWAICGCQRKK